MDKGLPNEGDYLLGANKTEHYLTDDMKRRGSIKFLRKYLCLHKLSLVQTSTKFFLNSLLKICCWHVGATLPTNIWDVNILSGLAPALTI